MMKTLFGLLCVLLAVATQAQAADTAPIPTTRSAVELFDRAAEILGKNAAAAKPLFAASAIAFENEAAETNDQAARGSAFYNAGAAHQLAGDRGRALLNFRRATLLAPLTPGLNERLASARAEARGEPSGSGLAMNSTGEWFKDAARSFGRSLRWQFLAVFYLVFWAALVARVLLPQLSRLRPHAALLWISGVLCVLSAASFAILAREDAAAAHDAVILTETLARSEPDDLVGQTSGAAFKPGRELTILEERRGGNGQLWWRVRPVEELPIAATKPLWIPASSGARVIDSATAVVAAR